MLNILYIFLASLFIAFQSKKLEKQREYEPDPFIRRRKAPNEEFFAGLVVSLLCGLFAFWADGLGAFVWNEIIKHWHR